MVSILSILILSVRNRRWVFLFNRKNPLSVTKVICRQSLKTWRQWVLTSSKLKFNFESSTWSVEVIRTRFPCPGLLDLLKNLFLKKKKSEIWVKYAQWCYRFKFVEAIRLHWLSHVGFGESRFLNWCNQVINSNSWFLAILKETLGLLFFKLIFFS